MQKLAVAHHFHRRRALAWCGGSAEGGRAAAGGFSGGAPGQFPPDAGRRERRLSADWAERKQHLASWRTEAVRACRRAGVQAQRGGGRLRARCMRALGFQDELLSNRGC